MMNNITLVGKIVDKKINQDNILTVDVSVSRKYKNSDGVYDADIIPVQITGSTAESTNSYCRIGDIIGIRGSLKNNDGNINVCTDKVTFITVKKEIEDKETSKDDSDYAL